MFGIVRPCRHRLSAGLFAEWTAHLCGLCLALRDLHGQAARAVTNYDGLLVSVLTDAQRPLPQQRRLAGPCALRGLRRAEVVDASAAGGQLAAAASLLLAAGKLGDHVTDGDGAFGRPLVATAGRLLADRWQAAGTATAAGAGFDAAVIAAALSRQVVLERSAGVSLLELTEPAETAAATLFAHTAVLAGRPHNAAALAEAGRFFGRIAHLLDAATDLAADRAAGAYNPLAATGTSLAQARQHCEAAMLGLRLAVADLDLDRRDLVDALLDREVARSIRHAFARLPGGAVATVPQPPPQPGGMPGDGVPGWAAEPTPLAGTGSAGRGRWGGFCQDGCCDCCGGACDACSACDC